MLFGQANHSHPSPALCIRTTKVISTIGDVSILSTSPVTPSRASTSTTRRLLARLHSFRDHGNLGRGRRTETVRTTRQGSNVRGKSRGGGGSFSSRIPRFSAHAASAQVSKGSPSSSSTPRSLQRSRPNPIHGVSDLVFDPFYYTKLVLSAPGEVSTSKRPSQLARAPTLEGVHEVDEREEQVPDRFAMDEDDEDEDVEANALLWRPPSPHMLPPPLPEVPSYYHYEDDFPMQDARNLNQASGYASSSSSCTGSPTPSATPTTINYFRALDVDMDDDGFGNHEYDSDVSEGSSMDAEIDVIEEDSDDEVDDVAMSTSQILHRTAYETILTSTVHQYLGYMEDGGRVTVELPWSYSEDRTSVAGRNARLRARRSITYPRRFSSLMGVSLAIMKDNIGVSTGF